jgi:hypothetical protein
VQPAGIAFAQNETGRDVGSGSFRHPRLVLLGCPRRPPLRSIRISAENIEGPPWATPVRTHATLGCATLWLRPPLANFAFLNPDARSHRDDCMAGHVRFELRNVAKNYLFERSHKFPGIQPNSGRRDYSRLSCGVAETQQLALSLERGGTTAARPPGTRMASPGIAAGSQTLWVALYSVLVFLFMLAWIDVPA